MLKPKYNKKLILIESHYFEYLTKEEEMFVWKSLEIEDFPFIPVIVTANAYKKDNKILYEIIYELPYTHEYILTSNNETFITEKNGEGKSLNTKQIKVPNELYDTSIDSPIRLDNDDIDIAEKLKKNNDIPMHYINKKRRKLFELNRILDKSSSLIINEKTLKKETPK